MPGIRTNIGGSVIQSKKIIEYPVILDETIYSGITVAAGTTNNIPLAQQGPFPIGFDFVFSGNTYSNFYVNENGLLMFSAPNNQYSTNSTIPTAAVPNNYIAAFWDNLTIHASGNITYRTIGDSPNRKLIVQWYQMNSFSPGSYMGTFAVILNETTNVIKIQYRLLVYVAHPNNVGNGSSATIGIENIDGSAGVLYSFNTPSISEKQAITFTPNGNTYTIDPKAAYEWIYLTRFINTPEAEPVQLISPRSGDVVGGTHTFTWNPSDRAVTYTFIVSLYSDLSGAQIVVSNLTGTSYTVTTLLPHKTYYWGVFAVNPTGMSWVQITPFFTA
jgi:hypothetical protein